jgi:hypothetical protein
MEPPFSVQACLVAAQAWFFLLLACLGRRRLPGVGSEFGTRRGRAKSRAVGSPGSSRWTRRGQIERPSAWVSSPCSCREEREAGHCLSRRCSLIAVP